jgi:hypothetical protein
MEKQQIIQIFIILFAMLMGFACFAAGMVYKQLKDGYEPKNYFKLRGAFTLVNSLAASAMAVSMLLFFIYMLLTAL